MKWKDSCSLEEKLWLTGGIFKSEDSTFLTKFHIVKAVIFLVVMHECESWTILKAEHWRIVVLDKTVESPLECEEIKPINPKGNQPWTFIGRTDAGAETPILWPPHVKNWKNWCWEDWRQEEKGMTEDEMVGWHHWLDGHDFEWTPGVGDGQGGLACCRSRGHKGSDMTERLNWTEVKSFFGM